MTFTGWHRVGDNLGILADAPGSHLNEGQRASLRALAGRLPEHGVVIAVDSRASQGPYISSQTVKKVIEMSSLDPPSA